MQTIRLRVNEKTYGNLMWLLTKFKKNEIQVIKEDKDFVSVQAYLQDELNNIDTGDASFDTLSELEEKLEKRKKENYIQLPEDSEISPTYLAGKWKDWIVDTKTYRKQLWQRKI